MYTYSYVKSYFTINIHIHTYIHMFTYKHTYIYTYSCVWYTHTYIHVHIFICQIVFYYEYTHVYIHINTNIHTYTYIRMYNTHTHTYMYIYAYVQYTHICLQPCHQYQQHVPSNSFEDQRSNFEHAARLCCPDILHRVFERNSGLFRFAHTVIIEGKQTQKIWTPSWPFWPRYPA